MNSLNSVKYTTRVVGVRLKPRPLTLSSSLGHPDVSFFQGMLLGAEAHRPCRKSCHQLHDLLLIFQLIMPCSCDSHRARGAGDRGAQGEYTTTARGTGVPGRVDEHNEHGRVTGAVPFDTRFHSWASCRVAMV